MTFFLLEKKTSLSQVIFRERRFSLGVKKKLDDFYNFKTLKIDLIIYLIYWIEFSQFN